jgi:4-diphosphocytidyl-2-C-methyl-D-erythritol kinase
MLRARAQRDEELAGFIPTMNHTAFGAPLGGSDLWPAPAKLNLCLHIVGRRADGYHLLQSAIQFITLADELRFYQRPHGVIERVSGPLEVPAETDLVVRAARLLATHAAVTQGVAIAVDKQIPMQAGLGGGSSDAATVLVALNQLWQLHLSVDELAALGVKLGADVPVFVGCHAAWVEGIGERLTTCDYPQAVYLVLKPDIAVSTAEIFQAAELTRNSPLTTIRAFLSGGGRNDCTATVCARYSQVAEALDWLRVYGDARLTGTGACVFVGMPDEAAARAAAARIPARWSAVWSTFVARGVNRSPLLARLAQERGEQAGS